MSNNQELDKIINNGKANTQTAMIVFAIELKSQGEKLDEVKEAIKSDNERYALARDHEDLKRRVDGIYNFAWKFLTAVFLALTIGTVVYLRTNT